MSDPRVADLTGTRFGRWVVLGRVENMVRPSGRKQSRWLCVCDCGNRKKIVGASLRDGRSRSCGCLRQELLPSLGGRSLSPGQVSYTAAHQRVYRTKGSANLHPCVDCGSTAREWSYDHSDPGEWSTLSPTGAPLVYSGKPEHYVPRCTSCHRLFDRGRDVQQA